MTNEERKTMELLRKDNVELANTITSLKRQIGGYKKSNAEYKKKVEHYKVLDKEGDELYEEKIRQMNDMEAALRAEIKEISRVAAQAEDLKQTVKTKDDFITSLQDELKKTKKEKSDTEAELLSLKSQYEELKESMDEYINKPWWKRIF